MTGALCGSAAELSVVIPLYNKIGTICRAIDSIINQEIAVEIVVVNDGSTDGSAELVAERFGDRVILIHQLNSGPGAARNKGVSSSSAQMVGFLDADDEWLPGFVTAALSALNREPRVAAYVCGYDAGSYAWARPNKVALLDLRGPAGLPADADGERLKIFVDAMHSSCIVVRRTVFQRLGGYYTVNGCRYGEDSYLWLNLLLREQVYWDPRPLVRFHVEDSALGFAQQKRLAARPISVDGEALAIGLSSDMARALERVTLTYAKSDFDMMWRSGAYNAATRLGRRYGFVRPLSAALNPLRYLRRAFRSL